MPSCLQSESVCWYKNWHLTKKSSERCSSWSLPGALKPSKTLFQKPKTKVCLVLLHENLWFVPSVFGATSSVYLKRKRKTQRKVQTKSPPRLKKKNFWILFRYVQCALAAFPHLLLLQCQRQQTHVQGFLEHGQENRETKTKNHRKNETKNDKKKGKHKTKKLIMNK